MCQVLVVSRSGYYKWLKAVPSNRSLRNEALTQEIRRVFESKKKRYGSPRIAMELRKAGIKVSRPLVAKLMKKEQLRSIIKRKFKSTTDSNHHYPIVANELDRVFTTERINQAWVSDITYIRTKKGWLYLTMVLDLFDRKVIGWALSTTLHLQVTSIAAFKMALINRPVDPTLPLIFHSDRGVQYACKEFVDEVNKCKSLVRSMSRKGNCWDNAVAESFFKSLKVELIYQQRYETKKEAELSVFEYIEGFYNTTRRHSQLNNLTILEFHQAIFNLLKNVA